MSAGVKVARMQWAGAHAIAAHRAQRRIAERHLHVKHVGQSRRGLDSAQHELASLCEDVLAV